MSFAVGALVRARGREWVVGSGSTDELLLLRPLGGIDAETAGLLTQLEPVEPATFGLPDPEKRGDHRSAQLLRDALRLGFRAGAGPFRSFARIALEPRPYQLVPLLMALRMDPVRLLIADDVGIGKTIEAALIARELLDTGVAQRLAVLCPPHLAKQWKKELDEKFQIDATLVLASTAARLERDLVGEQTLFDLHPHVIVSTDFIKSERRRRDFLRTCPELVIVDEAHASADPGEGRGTKQQRHELLRGLAADAKRNLILVTATPHSGKTEAFRSLVALLDPALRDLPDDLSGEQHARDRRRLARVMVQRRRGDIVHYVGTDTYFPQREEREESYVLTPEYKAFFDKVLRFAREAVRDTEGGRHRQRVRYWSALALLRSVASSPDAAAATLRQRARTADSANIAGADELGRRLVLDEAADEEEDSEPGADYDDAESSTVTRRLQALAREAEALRGKADAKIHLATRLIAELVRDGHLPIVFCRFIPTARYVAAALKAELPKGVEVVSITGEMPADEREAAVLAMGEHERRVLVATDCLSEGINLQHLFDAVVHYDLSWNPTRHEQREGRVDRYGQPKQTVRVLTLYGRDTAIDGVVLDVLLRKHRRIRQATGVSVPVPVDASAVMDAVLEGLLLRGSEEAGFEQLLLLEPELRRQQELFGEWDLAAEREKRSRTMFAQEAIKPEEVAAELDLAREAAGGGADVQRFMNSALSAFGRPPMPAGSTPLIRTDPMVAELAAEVLDTAIDPLSENPVASRCGVIRTTAVSRTTTLLLLRHRFHLLVRVGSDVSPLLAEDCSVVAFEGSGGDVRWLPREQAEELMNALPSENVHPGQAAEFARTAIAAVGSLEQDLIKLGRVRADELLASHRKVRDAKGDGVAEQIEAQPPDVLGVYVLLPTGSD